MRLYTFILAFSLLTNCSQGQTSKTRGPGPATQQADKDDSPGRYVAFLVGVDKYQLPLKSLDYPVENVRQLESILPAYAFQKQNILLVSNPTQESFFQQVKRLKSTVRKGDNLFIYIAAHGTRRYDKFYYWLPSDAKSTERDSWIDVEGFLEEISQLGCKHILLIIDSCHGGSIFNYIKKMDTPIETLPILDEEFVNGYKSSKSGEAITSGAAQEEVPDKSHFFEALMSALTINKGKDLLSSSLYNYILGYTSRKESNPAFRGVRIKPQYSKVHKLEDEGGQFVFYKPNGTPGASISIIPTTNFTVEKGTKEIPVVAQKGQTIKVVASGSITVGQWVGDVTPNGTNTVQNIPFPTEVDRKKYNIDTQYQHGALLYRLSSADRWELCGDHCSFKAPQSGRQTIEFIVNDRNHGDNHGKFTVQLSVQ